MLQAFVESRVYWEPIFALENAYEIEAHWDTGEVFVLMRVRLRYWLQPRLACAAKLLCLARFIILRVVISIIYRQRATLLEILLKLRVRIYIIWLYYL